MRTYSLLIITVGRGGRKRVKRGNVSLKLGGLVVVLILAVSIGAGASAGKRTKGQGPAAANAPSGTVTLSGWSVGATEEKLLKQVISAFERSHPKIKVSYDAIPNYDQAMLAKFSARRPPDVFYVNSEKAPTWIKQGLILPLDSYIKKSKFAVAPFYPKLMTAFRANGKTYGFPKDWNPLVLQINTAMLAKVKAKPPKTWAQLRSVAQKLRSAVPGGKPLCLAAEWQRMLAFVYQNGGSVLQGNKPTFTSTKVRQAVEFYVGLQKSGLGDQASKLGAGWCGEALGKEKAAISFEGGWVYPYLPENFPSMKWKFFPMVKGKQAGTLAFTASYSMGTHSKNKEAGWELIRYLTGRTGMKLWSSKGLVLPARKDVKVKPPGPSRAPLLAAAASARAWAWPPGFDKVWTVANNELGAVFEGKQTIPEMLKKINDEAEDALN